jgi:protein-S-isoprenylcysteine O-methyltransferase Ste14
MRSALQTLGWLACIIYSTIPSFWLVIHPRVEYWRSHHSPYSRLLPLWFGMWGILAVITAPWRRVVLYDQPWMWLPAIALFLTGIWMYTHSGGGFSWKQLGGLPEILPGHPEQRLITTGLRSRVRHPVYLAHLCEMLAWSLGTGLLALYALLGFALLTGAFMLHLEDAELEKRFGPAYREYRAQVPSLLPRWKA